MSDTKGNLFIVSLVPMIGVMAAIVLVMYLAYVWVSGMSRDQHAPPTAVVQQQIEERIRPVGRVVVVGAEEAAAGDEATADAPSAPAPAAPAPAARELDGAAVYRVACGVCHSAGIAGAPRTGDASGWGPRVEQGMDTLVKHAIEGFQGPAGYMPPRGGHSNLTDQQVRNAVQYMVDQLEN